MFKQYLPIFSKDPRGESEPLFSRTGYTHPHGKKTVNLKVRCTEMLDETLREMAANAGIPLSEYIHSVLDDHCFGIEHVASLAAERIRRAARNAVPNVGHIDEHKRQ